MGSNDNEIIDDFPQLILASASERRALLLKEEGIPFTVWASAIQEKRNSKESCLHFAKRMAATKALFIAGQVKGEKPCFVLGADTVIALKNKVIGKPANKKEAVKILKKLSGKTHRVITGYAIIHPPDKIRVCEAVISKVTMKKMAQRDITAYVKTGEPLDKAGAYAVQGKGRRFIEKIEGSVANVIGLPVAALMPWFKRLKIT